MTQPETDTKQISPDCGYRKPKFRPILFSTPMVQAILDGRKTQTRRTKGLLKIDADATEVVENKSWPKQGNYAARFELKSKGNLSRKYYQVTNIIKCPYGQVGEILWVRETWQHTKFAINLSIDDENSGYIYKASQNGKDWEENVDEWTWKPSIYMPKEACRIFLKVKSVRVERLKDISEPDAIAEGAKHGRYIGIGQIGGSVREGFFELWEKINGADSLIANPWVWVIEFERCGRPLGFL